MYCDNSNSFYKYVHIKVKQLNKVALPTSYINDSTIQMSDKVKLMLSIINVSDKMLYNEVKAEQSFLTLINAAVSHELRNPLNSLIGQIALMNDFLIKLYHIISVVNNEQLKSNLTDIFGSIAQCNKKLRSATKFIDFFVHDMLDYTILQKDQSNFTKQITIFNIQEAINEIIESLEDKISMRQICI